MWFWKFSLALKTGGRGTQLAFASFVRVQSSRVNSSVQWRLDTESVFGFIDKSVAAHLEALI